MKRLLFVFALILCLCPSALAAGFDHQVWDGLVREHVKPNSTGASTEVDYDGMLASQEQLKVYLDSLAAVDEATFAGWPKADQLAFLINGYNAWTVERILTRYPDLDSIKDLGSFFKSPWKKRFIPLLGREMSLDDIEHGLIRAPGSYDDPRIHFAVNCASIGCPALRPEAYVGERLDLQLQDAERLFLTDSSRNRFEDGVFKISSIFKWYGDDFRKGYQGIVSLEQYLLSHGDLLGISKVQQQTLTDKPLTIQYLQYDWKLNRVSSQ